MWQPIQHLLRWVSETTHQTEEDPDHLILTLEEDDLMSLTCQDALRQYFETHTASDSILDAPYPLNRYQRNRHVGLF